MLARFLQRASGSVRHLRLGAKPSRLGGFASITSNHAVKVRLMSTASANAPGGAPVPEKAAAPAAKLPPLPTIFNVEPANFEAMLKSSVPVIVNCWADFAPPCHELTPRLELAIQQYAGKLCLGHLNIEQQQAIAQELMIAKLPTVFGIFKGQVLTKVEGTISDPDIQKLCNLLVDFAQKHQAQAGEQEEEPQDDIGKAEKLMKQAELALARELLSDASQIYSAVIDNYCSRLVRDRKEQERKEARREGRPIANKDEDEILAKLYARATAGLIRCALVNSQADPSALDIAKHLATALQKDTEKDVHLKRALSENEVRSALTALAMSEDLARIGDRTAADLLKVVQADAEDHQSRYDLAVRLFADGQFEAGMNEALQLVKRGRTWENGKGKTLALRMIESLGDDHPLGKTFRRKLTNYLLV